MSTIKWILLIVFLLLLGLGVAVTIHVSNVLKVDRSVGWDNNDATISLHSPQNALLIGGSSGIGRELVNILHKQDIPVTYTSGPRTGTSDDSVDLSDENSIKTWCQRYSNSKEASNPDWIWLNAGVHNRDNQEMNYKINTEGLFYLLYLLMTSGVEPKKVIYTGSRSSRLYEKLPSVFRPGDGTYGHSKWLGESIMCHLCDVYPDIEFVVIAPPMTQTNISKPSRWQKKADVQVVTNTMWNIAQKSQHFPQVFHWENGIPSKWKPADNQQAIHWLIEKRPEMKEWLNPPTREWNYVGTASVLIDQEPDTLETLSRIVDSVGFEHVRVVGALHSYAKKTYDRSHKVTIRLNKLRDVHWDAERARLTVQAGISINEVQDKLEDMGHTLPAMGSHGIQSFIGAVCTGTHGHAKIGASMAECVVAMQVIDQLGLRWLEETELPDWLISFGRMGIIVAVTIQSVKADRRFRFKTQMLQTSELENFPVFDHDHCKMIPMLHTNNWLATTIDIVDKTTELSDTQPECLCNEQKSSALSPQVLKGVFPMLNYFLEKFPRMIKKNAETEMVIDNLTARVITSGYCSRSGRTFDKVLYGQMPQSHLNVEFALPFSNFALVVEVMQKFRQQVFNYQLPPLTFYCYYRFGGATKKANLALNYGYDVVFVDCHISKEWMYGRWFLDEIVQKLRETLGTEKVRIHGGKDGDKNYRSAWPQWETPSNGDWDSLFHKQ